MNRNLKFFAFSQCSALSVSLGGCTNTATTQVSEMHVQKHDGSGHNNWVMMVQYIHFRHIQPPHATLTCLQNLTQAGKPVQTPVGPCMHQSVEPCMHQSVEPCMHQSDPFISFPSRITRLRFPRWAKAAGSANSPPCPCARLLL